MKRLSLRKKIVLSLSLTLVLILAVVPAAWAAEPPSVALQPGDILFRDNDNGYEPIIGYWNHCGIYIGNGTVVEAVSTGVVLSSVEGFYIDGAEIKIKRLAKKGKWWWNRKGLRSEVIQAAVDYAESQVEKPYDYFFIKYNEDAHYCSELVWHSYYDGLQNAGSNPIDLDSDGGLIVRPDDLWESSKLELVRDKHGNGPKK